MPSNTTTNVILPSGTSNHGNPDLICFPANWSDVATFFLGNYIAHAATVLSRPGQPAYYSVNNIASALFFPVNGVRQGFRSIFSLANFGATDLRTAARAGALCRVVKLSQYARTLTDYRLSEGPSFLRIKIHGRVILPEGYGLAILPSNARFVDDVKKDDHKRIVCSDWSIVKILVAIAQLLFAIATLYRTKGDQINHFGYAAFGLTVIQYGLMSLINLVGNLMCPQYPTMYLVQTSAMLDAQREGAVIEGTIGVVDEDKNDALPSEQQPGTPWQDLKTKVWWIPLCWSPLVVTLGIIGALTHFQKGKSSHYERVLTMFWLAIGNLTGVAGFVEHPRTHFSKWEFYRNILTTLFIFSTAGVVVLAGFWVVAQEILQYGVCTRVG